MTKNEDLFQKEIDTLIQFYEDSDNILPLIEFSKNQNLGFNSLHSEVRQADGYTCYQYALTHILDKKFPGLVSYIVKKAKNVKFNKLGAKDEYYLNIINYLICNIETKAMSYEKIANFYNINLIKSDNPAFQLAKIVENELDKNSFLFFFGSFHGELYTKENSPDGNYVALINQSSPIKLWKYGESQEWILDATYKRGCCSSNFEILEQDLIFFSKYFEFQNPKMSTLVCPSSMLNSIFQKVNLKRVVESALKNYAK
jgi:hypothetical protein